MATAMLKPGAFRCNVRCSKRRSGGGSVAGRRTVRVQAAASNVEEARQWIANWRDKNNQKASQKAALSNRTSWFPGTQLPEHLDGSLPGDFGFDPLGLGVEDANLAWYVQAELVHSRFAMLAVAGILLPECAAALGIRWPGADVPWYDAGKYPYFAPASSLFGIQLLLFAWVEVRRLQDIRKPGSANQDPIFSKYKLPDDNKPGYPGGIFDPFNWSRRSNLDELKLKELKNGRLAMLAFAGFVAQAFTTGKTPLANLSEHLADPWNTTVWNNDLSRL